MGSNHLMCAVLAIDLKTSVTMTKTLLHKYDDSENMFNTHYWFAMDFK